MEEHVRPPSNLHRKRHHFLPNYPHRHKLHRLPPTSLPKWDLRLPRPDSLLPIMQFHILLPQRQRTRNIRRQRCWRMAINVLRTPRSRLFNHHSRRPSGFRLSSRISPHVRSVIHRRPTSLPPRYSNSIMPVVPASPLTTTISTSPRNSTTPLPGSQAMTIRAPWGVSRRWR